MRERFVRSVADVKKKMDVTAAKYDIEERCYDRAQAERMMTPDAIKWVAWSEQLQILESASLPTYITSGVSFKPESRLEALAA